MPADDLPDRSEGLAGRHRARASAPEVVRGMVVAFVVAGLLGSGSLLDLAERQPFGWERDLLIGVAGAIDRTANALSLNRPVDVAAEALGRADESPDVDVDALLEASRARNDGATGPTRPALRTVTPSEPLSLYVGGDSMVRELGNAMKQVVDGRPAESRTDFRVISGLTRDDYFDWPAHLAQVAAEDDPPDAMVLMFGANDYQGIKTADGTVFQPGSDGWRTEYRSRVADVMDLLDQPGTTLHWVGLPVMRSDTFTSHAKVMNEIYRSEAAERPWVTFVPTFELFSDDDGGYAPYLTVDGQSEPMRQEDGVHWSAPGARRAAGAVYDAVAETWDIGP